MKGGKEFACPGRWHGFNLWSGKIPHTKGQATKPVHNDYWTHGLETVLNNEQSHCNEKPVPPQLESSCRSPHLRKACIQQWRSRTAKNKHMNKITQTNTHLKTTTMPRLWILYQKKKSPLTDKGLLPLQRKDSEASSWTQNEKGYFCHLAIISAENH